MSGERQLGTWRRNVIPSILPRGTWSGLSLVFAAVLAPSSSALAQSEAQPEAAEEKQPYAGSIIRRWSPLVSDMDRAIELYRDILGFELARLYEDQPDSYVFEIFDIERGTTTRHAIFDAGEDKRVLSVVEVPGMTANRAGESPRMSVLLVNANGRFDEIVGLLKERGYAMLNPHSLGPNGIEVGFIDGDGHLYSLYEIPYEGEIDLED